MQGLVGWLSAIRRTGGSDTPKREAGGLELHGGRYQPLRARATLSLLGRPGFVASREAHEEVVESFMEKDALMRDRWVALAV